MQEFDQREQVKFWQDDRYSNLELLKARNFTHQFPLHSHDEFTICVIQQGLLAVDYRQENYRLPPGKVFIINPGELHQGGPIDDNGWTYRVFYPKAELFKQIASNLADSPRDVPFFPNAEIHDLELTQMLLRLHRRLEDDDASQLEQDELFHSAMSHLILHHSDDQPVVKPTKAERYYVNRVRAYIDEHFAEPLSLDDLASIVCLNPSYFLRVFKKSVGLSPHAYLTQVRINRAKEMMAAGMPLTEIAPSTGFYDQSHFSNRFKRVFGLTPGQYTVAFR